jgi:sortase A
MTPTGFCRRFSGLLLTLAAVGLGLVQACSDAPSINPAAPGSQAGISAEAAATLTAWPTPPMLVARAPTPASPPQSLWPAFPSVQAAQPTAAVLPTESLGGAGSLPPAVRLLIPRLELDVPVVEIGWTMILHDGTWHSEWETADNAAGHHRGSANPGEVGNMIISGHHNTKGEVFRLVSEVGMPGNALRLGDQIVVVAEDGQQYVYAVVRWDRFEEHGADPEQVREHARYLQPTDTPTLTLVTCWPYESNTHRVVVIADLQQ